LGGGEGGSSRSDLLERNPGLLAQRGQVEVDPLAGHQPLLEWHDVGEGHGECSREKTGPSPVDRSRSGSKHHLIACGRGTPLAASLTGGNRNDITQMIPLVDAVPPVRGRRGRPRRRPGELYGDRAYHSRAGRRELRRRGIQARIARPTSGHGSGLGKKRWVVERTIAWLHQYRRLRVRYERRDDIHEAFLAIGCSLICLKLLQAEESF
jgi:transposase